ncbi:MAG: PilT/PilU family type 4a pilus ATPase [Candidatus Omnitrophica bacterium]|nr:PilT/PilU family type 4a pilus ATPase [Candidatus Omnitrophota bacterium]
MAHENGRKPKDDTPLGESLIKKNLITRPQLRQALSAQEKYRQPIGKVMIQLGLISEKDLTALLSEQLGIPHISLDEVHVDQEVLKLVPRHFAKRFMLVPVKKEGKVLTIVMENPRDLMAIDTVQLTTGCEVKTVLGRSTEIKKAIRKYYPQGSEDEEDDGTVLGKGVVTAKEEEVSEKETVPARVTYLDREPTINTGLPKKDYSQMQLQDLLEEMTARNASDIYLSAGKPPYLRVNGILVMLNLPPLKGTDIERLMGRLITEREREIFDKRKSYDISFESGDLGRFRMNIAQQTGTLACAIRHVTRDIPDLDELGVPPVAKELISHPNGLVIITGPNGSGKSTTIASLIEYVNGRTRCRIITIEDPIEYIHQSRKAIVQQREFGYDTLTFAEAVKQVARQDPDIVMVGEMRDLATMKASMTLAEAGYLVLSTLHTGDATHAVSRIVDSFPSEQQVNVRIQLSRILVGVVAQKLLPKADGTGRVLATEVMSINPAIQTLIRWNNLHQLRMVIETSREAGMHTMDQALLELFKSGEISKQVLLENVTDRGVLNA